MKNYITYAKTSDNILEYEARHRQVAYEAATEAIVLLENNGVLPLKPQKVALYGAGAGMTIKGGSGSGEVNERHSVSILEGMETAGFIVTTKSWIADYEKEYEDGLKSMEDTIAAALKKGQFSSYLQLFLQPYTYPFGREITPNDIQESDTDTCIYIIARQSGEGHDRKIEHYDFQLSPQEKKNLSICTQNYQKVIVVLNAGASFDTEFMEEIPGIDALVYMCQLGTAGGTAFADIVTGKVTPSGKLTDTWAKSYQDIPFGNEYSYLNGNLEKEFYKEGIYVGYRYFDTFGVKPAYPFGYGKSYTRFQIRYESMRINRDETIAVTVCVKNIGRVYSGKEVVQLYASCPQGKLKKEYQRLVAFAKTKVLAPGEEQRLMLWIPLEYLTSYDEETASDVLEAGTYVLRLGDASDHTGVCGEIQIKENIVYAVHINICPLKEPLEDALEDGGSDIQISEENSREIMRAEDHQKTAAELLMKDALDCIMIHPEMLIKQNVRKNHIITQTQKEWIEKTAQQLSTKEKIDLVVGAGLLDGFLNSSYINVPGVAGNTTSKLLSKGIVNMPLADGPAGLRLSRRSTINKKGRAKMIDVQLDMIRHFPSFLKKFLFGNPEKETMYYQYTTAFPVETALAQTWNEDLLVKMGQAVGEEMKEYGVKFWLAPALNIHRNPLCGRNYEYYSEDPMLSGKMAAAITRGVQQMPGCFVTLKHFCANNQEENRDQVSSEVSERALREIYLRGFEIAVKEGNAKGVMTSYNRVNGVYTSNSSDLLHTVLRKEWGFDGLVMTDWTATGKNKSDPALCIKAGNDLIMPGLPYDKKRIRKALKQQEIRKEDLDTCVKNILTLLAWEK